ncbi:hypothetical protein AB0F17_05715 [Nonomuraea sp. NPDC026600]|uniref:hypothetical protein n=1 Tax=Nonomuraea sp. NPDC026600 TaxID=3155363 RepID=UPI0033D01DBF
MTGRWSPLDWIQYEWNEHRTGLGAVRSSLGQTRGWDHHLGPWLDPGNTPGVSVCRLVVEGRVVVLSRLRSGGSDSRRTLRVMAYLGGDASPTARPTVQQALALAPEWAEQAPPDPDPVDLGELTGPFAERRDALEHQARAGARDLAPIVSAALRNPTDELAVVSQGDPFAQLWGVVNIFELVMGRRPETFSTYENDDRRQGAEIVFLRQWPGPSSRAPRRQRVDLREGDVADLYGEMAAYVVEAYARGALGELTRRAGLTEGMPAGRRIELLQAALSAPAPTAPPPTRAPQPPQARRPSPEPPSRVAPTPPRESPAPAAVRDMVADYQTSLHKATTSTEVRAILEEFGEWLATRAPELKRSLNTAQGHAALRMLLVPESPPAPRKRAHSAWLNPQWLVLAGLSMIVLVLQIFLLIR